MIDFDIETFKKQKAQLAQYANMEVAIKVKLLKDTIKEIRELVAVSGITLSLKAELESAIEAVDELHPDWNSSSYDC